MLLLGLVCDCLSKPPKVGAKIGRFVCIVDVLVQQSESNAPSERHLTKAVVEWHAHGTLKKNGKGWDNYYA